MRNGSEYHVKTSVRIRTASAMAALESRDGKTFIRNETVSVSITIKSTKLTVISSTSCLNCDSRIKRISQASEIAAATAGRRSSTIQQKLKKHHESRNASFGMMPDSVAIRIASAARCSAANIATRAAWLRFAAEASNRRVVSEAIAGGMTFAAPGHDLLNLPPGSGRRHQTVIMPSWQARDRFRPHRQVGWLTALRRARPDLLRRMYR